MPILLNVTKAFGDRTGAGVRDLFQNAKKSGSCHEGGRTKEIIACAYVFSSWLSRLNTFSHVR